MKHTKKQPVQSPDYEKNVKEGKTCLLMYSGGVDTSISVMLLKQYYGYDVITCTVDLGQKVQDPVTMGKKALKLGAVKHVTVDAIAQFAKDWILPSLLANAYYDEKYCLSTSIARPITAKKAVETAQKLKVDAIAHGCKGHGADAFRLNMVFQFLAPKLPVIMPIRDWNPSRAGEVAFAVKKHIPIPVSHKNPFSYDENLWGVAINYGTVDSIEKPVPEETFIWTVPPLKAPEKPAMVTIGFKQGIPVTLNGTAMGLVRLIDTLNTLGGKHGIGRKDMIENGLYGNKFRWVYECPAADILITSHKELEKVVLPKQTLYFKEQIVDKKWAELAYNSFFYTPLMDGLNAFIKTMQASVTGSVTLLLYKGSIQVVSRQSGNSLVTSVSHMVKDTVPYGYEEHLFTAVHGVKV